MADEQEFETASDKLEAMMDGSYFEGESDSADTETVEANDEDTDSTEEESDTTEEEIDTTDPIDGEDVETEESDDVEEEEESEENAPVDDGNGEEPETVVEDTATDDNADTEAKDVDPKAEAEAVDYQKKYEELLTNSEKAQSFYDKVTSEFKANGKLVKGFTDPDKIIQSQQMLHGFEEKMSVFKEHKPFYHALQEQGMIQDTSKFDLAMSIAGGDKEAFKKHAENQGWDLLEMDMDKVEYDAARHTTSPLELALDEVMDTAQRGGVQDKMQQMLSKDWDADGVTKLLDSPQDRQLIVEHMGNGIFDAVQERISESLRTDVHGSFRAMNKYDQYRTASRELETEYQAYRKDEDSRNVQAKADDVRAAEVTRNEEQQQKTDYTAKVKANEKVANEARQKAVQASKPKQRTKRTVKKVNKMNLTGDNFTDYFNKEILGMK